MNNLFVNFSDPNTATIHLGEACDDPRIEIVFSGAAQLLTRRAKVEIVMAAYNKYLSESLRLLNNTLGTSDVWNQDGTIGQETEQALIADPITGLRGHVNRETTDERKLTLSAEQAEQLHETCFKFMCSEP